MIILTEQSIICCWLLRAWMCVMCTQLKNINIEHGQSDLSPDDSVHSELKMCHNARCTSGMHGHCADPHGGLRSCNTPSSSTFTLWSTNPLLSVGVIIQLRHSLVASGISVNQSKSGCRQGMKRNSPPRCIHSFISVTMQRNHSAAEAPHLLTPATATTAPIISVMRGED